jgi:hypothetical protein
MGWFCHFSRAGQFGHELSNPHALNLAETHLIVASVVDLRGFDVGVSGHPTTAVQRLRDAKKIPDRWRNAYVALKTQTREARKSTARIRSRPPC